MSIVVSVSEKDKAGIISDVCAALSGGDTQRATAILADNYPFEPFKNAGRSYTKREMLRIFLRDGFTDRYSSTRLIFPAALRLISTRLPASFPFHKNWRTDECHFAFWELTPTIDHIQPVSRGGADSTENWVTTSMVRNAAKGNFTIEELGWALHEPRSGWDGLMGWFLEQVEAEPSILADGYLRDWARAARLEGLGMA